MAGAYFQIVDYSAVSDLDGMSFCEWLCAEKGVAAILVSAFYRRAPEARLIRVCFAKNEVTLQAAAERLRLV